VPAGLPWVLRSKAVLAVLWQLMGGVLGPVFTLAFIGADIKW
jgi:hypothetical protein